MPSSATPAHAHPRRDAGINNHASLLTDMGKTEAEIIASLTALMKELTSIGCEP